MKVNFSSQFQSIVDKWGDLEAIVNVERDRRFTYREFHLVTNKIVNMLSTTFGMESCLLYTSPSPRDRG